MERSVSGYPGHVSMHGVSSKGNLGWIHGGDMQSTMSDIPSIGIALHMTQVATTVRNDLPVCKMVMTYVWEMEDWACEWTFKICTMRIRAAQKLVVLNFYPWPITTHQ